MIGDSQYGTTEVMRKLQVRGIRSHMAVNGDKARNRSGLFLRSDFEYQAEEDLYICPAGQKLYRRRYDKRRKATEYKAYKKVCASCQLRESCTRSKTGRTIMRHFGQELIDEALDQSRSKEAWRDRIRRRYLMEGSFAQGANLHHFKRSRWRRLDRQRIQDHLICAIQNFKILITRGLPPKIAAQAPNRPANYLKTLHTRFHAALPRHWKGLKTLIRPKKWKFPKASRFQHSAYFPYFRAPLGNNPLRCDPFPDASILSILSSIKIPCMSCPMIPNGRE